MGLKTESLCIALLFGVWGYLALKASPIYGPKAACFLQMCGYAALIVVMRIGSSDLAKISGPARWYGIASTIALVVAAYWLFDLVARVSEQQAAIAYVISGSYPLVVALLLHFTGKPMGWREWLGAGVVATGLIILGWPKK